MDSLTSKILYLIFLNTKASNGVLKSYWQGDKLTGFEHISPQSSTEFYYPDKTQINVNDRRFKIPPTYHVKFIIRFSLNPTKKTDIIQQKRICFRWKTWVRNAWKHPCTMRIKSYFIHFWLKYTLQEPYFTFCRKHRTFLKKHQWADSWLPSIFALSKDKKDMPLLKI